MTGLQRWIGQVMTFTDRHCYNLQTNYSRGVYKSNKGLYSNSRFPQPLLDLTNVKYCRSSNQLTLVAPTY